MLTRRFLSWWQRRGAYRATALSLASLTESSLRLQQATPGKRQPLPGTWLRGGKGCAEGPISLGPAEAHSPGPGHPQFPGPWGMAESELGRSPADQTPGSRHGDTEGQGAGAQR